MNHQDEFGRSPLHVAAAVDYADMVEFILEHGGNIDIRTKGEEQTAIHYAARSDAINSIQMLLGHGANIDARDSRNRTPLQVSISSFLKSSSQVLCFSALSKPPECSMT